MEFIKRFREHFLSLFPTSAKHIDIYDAGDFRLCSAHGYHLYVQRTVLVVRDGGEDILFKVVFLDSDDITCLQ